MKVHSPEELKKISSQTLRHYEVHALRFWEGTRDHDVTQNYRALLEAFPSQETLDILDFGCGPGRDLAYFKNMGHRAVGLDACSQFCEMARDYSGCEVLEQNFLQLNLSSESFDGIFANASLFHVPSQELLQVLEKLNAALRPKGILFTSNPRGSEEGWEGNRYGTFMELEEFQKYLESAGFKVEKHYYRPAGKPIHEQPWLAVVSRKI